MAVLGASNYTYVEPSWREVLRLDRLPRAGFAFFGGVPEIVVPDNLKSGVTKAGRYEPELNPTYADLAQHYGVAVIPARSVRLATRPRSSGSPARRALDPGPPAPSALLQLRRANTTIAPSSIA